MHPQIPSRRASAKRNTWRISAALLSAIYTADTTANFYAGLMSIAPAHAGAAQASPRYPMQHVGYHPQHSPGAYGYPYGFAYSSWAPLYRTPRAHHIQPQMQAQPQIQIQPQTEPSASGQKQSLPASPAIKAPESPKIEQQASAGRKPKASSKTMVAKREQPRHGTHRKAHAKSIKPAQVPVTEVIAPLSASPETQLLLDALHSAQSSPARAQDQASNREKGDSKAGVESRAKAARPKLSEPRHLPAMLQDKRLKAKERKRMFVETALPLMLAENEVLQERRETMLGLLARVENSQILDQQDRDWLRDLASLYKVKGDPLADPSARQQLRERVDIVPVDLALAQAATESGWGSSRHAHKRHNLFGIYSYASRGLLPRRREKGKKHVARSYDNLRGSIQDYMHTLNTHPAYKEVRGIRARLRAMGKRLEGTHLAEGLKKYSSLGRTYIKRIRAMIRANDLERRTQVSMPAGA